MSLLLVPDFDCDREDEFDGLRFTLVHLRIVFGCSVEGFTRTREENDIHGSFLFVIWVRFVRCWCNKIQLASRTKKHPNKIFWRCDEYNVIFFLLLTYLVSGLFLFALCFCGLFMLLSGVYFSLFFVIFVLYLLYNVQEDRRCKFWSVMMIWQNS